MSRSYEKINYYLRPNKQVERKIIIDILRSINEKLPLVDYRYLGLGSIYYFDFILLHKAFDMKDLISIDKEDDVTRFNFNKPYDFITFRRISSTEYLQEFKFDKNLLCWLDYDGSLDNNEFLEDDVKILGRNCNESDLVFITLNITHPHDSDNDISKKMKNEFISKHSNYIPQNLMDIKYTSKTNFPKLVQSILLNMLDESVEYNERKFHKIFSCVYEDNAPMYTLGGIFSKDEKFKKEELISEAINPFISFDRDNVNAIKIPYLTYHEKMVIDTQIKAIKDAIENGVDLNTILPFRIKLKEIKSYLEIYRYYPQYYEGIL